MVFSGLLLQLPVERESSFQVILSQTREFLFSSGKAGDPFSVRSVLYKLQTGYGKNIKK